MTVPTVRSLIKLRLDDPALPRPYKIPCGVVGLCLLFIPPTAVTVLLITLAEPIGVNAAPSFLFVIYIYIYIYIFSVSLSPLVVGWTFIS